MSRYRKGRICSACPKPIHDENRTGMCRTCYVTTSNRDPVMRRKRGKSLGKRLREDGAARERRLASLDKARACRDFEATKERGVHRRAMQELAARRMAWCPPEWRSTYRKMLSSGAYRAPEARRIILAHVAAVVERAGSGKMNGEKDTKARVKDAVLGSNRLLDALRGAAR